MTVRSTGGRFRYSAVIPFPVEHVWGLMIQTERMPEWNTDLAEVRDISGPMDRVGGGYRQVWQFFGLRMASKGLWQVVKVEPLRHREYRGITPMGPMVGRDWFEPVPEGTRLSVEIEYGRPFGPLTRLMEPLAQRIMARTMRANAHALTTLLRSE